MRLAPYAALLTACAAIVGACSLFVPFDDYAGTDEPAPSSDAATDSGVVDAMPLDPTCEGTDLNADPSNCGACGRRCACDAGRCPVEIVTDEADGANVTSADLGRRGVDGGDPAIYFARRTGVIARIDPDGGGYEATPPATGANALSFGSTNGIIGYRNEIRSFSRDRFVDGGAVVVVPARNALGPILYASNRVFWGDDDGTWWAMANRSDASVNRLTTAGKFATPVAITAAAGWSYWTDGFGTVVSTAVAPPGMLKDVLRVDAGDESITGIAVGARNIYLTQKSQGLLVYDFDGTTATFARRIPIADPESIVVDESHVYVTDLGGAQGRDRLLRFDANGLSQLVVGDTLTSPRVFGVDDAYVYFSSQTRIARVTR